MRSPSEPPVLGGHTVVGVFDGPNHAETALNELKDAGFSPDQISIVAEDTRESRDLVDDTGMEGAGTTGAGTGAFLGAISGGELDWMVGTLAGAGVPEEDARGYEEDVRQGSILLVVEAHDVRQAGQARSIFAHRGRADVRVYRTREGGG